MLIIVMCHIILGLHKGCTYFTEGVLHAMCELCHCFDLRGPLHRFKPHARMSLSVDKEWGVLHGGVNMIVICELSHWQPIIPIILSLIHEDAQVLLQFLVDMLHLPISLRVIGCGCCDFDVEEMIEFMHEL